MLAADRTVTVVALIDWFVRCGFIPALAVMKCSILSRVLWPSGIEQYHTESLAGLNDLDSGINCCIQDSDVMGTCISQ